MAEATHHEAVIEVIERERVVLELSLHEARVLRRVVGEIGGPPSNAGGRGATDAIHAALSLADIQPGGDAFTGRFIEHGG